MNAIFYDNLSDFDRESLYVEKSFDAMMKECFLALEMLDQRDEINFLKAEAKVIYESGTEEDLEYLYTEAQAETAEQKKNIFEKIFDGMINFITNVWNNFLNLFKSKSKEEISAATAGKTLELGFNIDGLKSALSSIEASVSSIEKMDGTFKKIGIGVAGAAGVGALAFTIKNSFSKKPSLITDKNAEETVSVLDGILKSFKNVLTKAKSLFTKDENRLPDNRGIVPKKDNVSTLQMLCNAIGKEINRIKNFFNLNQGKSKKPKYNVNKGTNAGKYNITPREQLIQGPTGQPKPKKPKADKNTPVNPVNPSGNADAKTTGGNSGNSGRTIGIAGKLKQFTDQYGESAYDDMSELDSVMMESASLEELEALIDQL